MPFAEPAPTASVVIPYFPYARQDRMAHGREAISARVVANMIEALGAARVIFIDIHNSAIQGFFNIPVDPLSAIPLMAEYFSKPHFSNAAIVSPDVGRAGMAGKYAERLNLPLVVMHKRRTGFSQVVTTHVVGDIAGHRPIIIDDLMAGGSVLKQIDMLYNYGAEGKAYFSITHPILLPSALDILNSDDRIEKLVTTNSIPLTPDRLHPKIEVLSVARLWQRSSCEFTAARAFQKRSSTPEPNPSCRSTRPTTTLNCWLIPPAANSTASGGFCSRLDWAPSWLPWTAAWLTPSCR